MDNLLEIINNCSDSELNSIVTSAINNAIKNSQEKDILGFLPNMERQIVHKGFINPNTKIRYGNHSMNSYNMKTTDYFYEFARYIKDKQIKGKGAFIKYIENFINNYFGINKNGIDYRDDYFDSLAFKTTRTDEEYFEKLNALEIGDLKGKNIAMCTERAAVAENLLSLFGIETYYCMGCVDNGGKTEPHCFIIAKAQNEYRLLDYSIPSPVYKNGKLIDYAPFSANIPLEEFEEVTKNGVLKTFDNYYYMYTSDGIKKVTDNTYRTYAVGVFELEKNNQHNK